VIPLLLLGLLFIIAFVFSIWLVIGLFEFIFLREKNDDGDFYSLSFDEDDF